MQTTVFEATRAKKVDLPFRCGPCGLARTTRIVVLGKGSAKTSFLANEREARALASSQAAIDVYTVADAALDLIACPACGARGKQRNDWIRSPSIYAAGGLVLVGASFVLAGTAKLNPAVAVVGIVMVIAGTLTFGFYRDRAKRASEAAASATFLTPRPTRQLAGTACAHCQQTIVLQSEGKRCKECKQALHTEDCMELHVTERHRTIAPFR